MSNHKTVDDLQKELKFLIRSFNPPIQQAEQAMDIVDTLVKIMVNLKQQLDETKES